MIELTSLNVSVLFKLTDIHCSKFFHYRQKAPTFHHCRLRNKCSNLNNDLFNNHLRYTTACECGSEREEVEHYFIAGNIFVQQQTDLLHGTHTFHSLNVRVLLYGSASDDSEELFPTPIHY